MTAGLGEVLADWKMEYLGSSSADTCRVDIVIVVVDNIIDVEFIVFIVVVFYSYYTCCYYSCHNYYRCCH